MKSKKYVYVGIAAAAIAIVIIAITQFNIIPEVQENSTPSSQVAFLDFSYDEANSDIRSTLTQYSINMTHPIRLSSQSDVHQYCNFLTDPKKQALVTYCTSAVLKDKEGFLGDVNMVGTPDLPGLVVVALQSNPMLSNYGDVKTVFNAVVNNTICKCWEKEVPGGFPTLSALVDKLRDTHLTTKDPTTSTPVMPLGNKHFKIELTTNESGYLWKLLVSK
jgi:predicted Rdx family selenoprotein